MGLPRRSPLQEALEEALKNKAASFKIELSMTRDLRYTTDEKQSKSQNSFFRLLSASYKLLFPCPSKQFKKQLHEMVELMPEKSSSKDEQQTTPKMTGPISRPH